MSIEKPRVGILRSTPEHSATTVSGAWIFSETEEAKAVSAALLLKQVSTARTVDIDCLFAAANIQPILDEFKACPPQLLWICAPTTVHNWTGPASKRLAV